MTAPRTFAILGVGLAIVGAIGTAIVRFVSSAPVAGAFGFGEAAMFGYVIEGLTWASIGAVLVTRRPQNAVGWLMVLVGVGYALSQLTVSLTFAFAAERTTQGERLAQITGWITVLLQLVAILQLAIGFLFPTGRVQSHGWGLFMRVFWAISIPFVVISLTQPGPLQLIPGVDNPFGFGPDLRGGRPIAPILGVATFVIFASLGISMVSRYRSAGRVERQQMKWFFLALGLSAIALGVATLESVFMDGPVSGNSLTVYVFAGAVVPVAIGIAILRYHLYDIDRLISRTIAYAAVTGILSAIFVGTILALQGLLASVTKEQTIPVAASTLAVFSLFQPVRRRVQSAVDRRFDRASYDADQTVRTFASRLRGDMDLGTVSSEIVKTASATVRPASASVWLRGHRTAATPR
ncbi:MAG TPA: hypothetical protein VGQ89_12535 [Candidatus Limnocylindrales bacterium]|nr:hypothetical protein [Candidatus Limnocylindrales bacterium]